MRTLPNEARRIKDSRKQREQKGSKIIKEYDVHLAGAAEGMIN
jgi:hypothetical protein